MSQQTLPRETSSASLGQVRPAEGGGDEEQSSSKSKEQRQQQLSSTSSSSSSRGSQQQQAGGTSSSSSGTGGGQQSSTAEFGDAAQYQELNPIGEGNVKLFFFCATCLCKIDSIVFDFMSVLYSIW